MKKQIYLTGPMRKFSSIQKEEFEKAKQLLESQGHSVQTALEQFERHDPQADDCPMDLIMKQRLLELLKSNMVVYLNDYEQDLRATHEIRIAKFLNMETRGINYMIKLTQNENGNDINQQTESSHASDQQS
ncbi:MAG TPA: DUF4406 domain-containing protein [Bacteroidia bacterium]|nr:DUF4406 domain-containing protein [Bacteroidia bacterium]